ncbi:MAG: chromosome segregation protein SMC [archaeon]|nr:MAG: chromosome segregation protein SMC [archaeon]
MPHIKKLHMHGFKSFAKPTEVLFENGMNIVVGPNGSGKSNVVDAICFVLGRLSAKSMRASKSAHLIYNGGKHEKPASAAKVSLVFDNTDRGFSLDANDVEVSRHVKRDGASTYKINNEIKTRQEVLELLAQAGIDPTGFNIILQAQIDTIIKMRAEEKREIIEEIAGISIYEDRKVKSLRELEKTENKLKEINTILKERSAFMNNLEKERKQALKHEHLKKQVKRCKASVINKKITDKQKQDKKIDSDIGEKQKSLTKSNKNIEDSRNQIEQNNKRIITIEKKIEKETGIEQDKLREVVLELKTDLTGLNIKKENLKDQIGNTVRKEESNNEEKSRLEQDIKELEQKSKVKVSKSEKDKYDDITQNIEELKKQLQDIELKQKSCDLKKSEIDRKELFLEEKKREKKSLQKNISELEKEISEISLKDINEEEIRNKKHHHHSLLKDTQSKIHAIEREVLKLITKKEINKKDVEEILSLEQCPKCKQKITKDYKEKLVKGVWETIKGLEREIENKEKDKKEIYKEVLKISKVIEEFVEKEKEIAQFYEQKKILNFKQTHLDKEKSKFAEIENICDSFKNEISQIKKEIPDSERLNRKHIDLANKIERLKEDLVKLKLKKPVQLYIERDFDTESTLKRREIEQCSRNVKQAQHDRLELESKLGETSKKLTQKNKQLATKEKEQEIIEGKFKKMISEKQFLQEENHKTGLKINEFQVEKNLIEQGINELKIDKARTGAEISTLDNEFKEFEGTELIKAGLEELERKLNNYESQLSELGNVNLRALEVYDKVRAEYEAIENKVKKLKEEQEEILKVIAEIDKKKKSAFMQTFNAINKYFSENFNTLSRKGTAFLEVEDKKDPFNGGVNILIKLAKGKYMDSHALSGGEKVIVALSLIFAIQKYKPYHFYIFDEIDAALDKRNSEKLSDLVGKDGKSQYIVITHNDVMINNAKTIYGASMQEGKTKLVGLKI